MKKNYKYVIVAVLFLLIMTGIIFYFRERYNKIIYKNSANHLLKEVYSLEMGDYIFSHGYLINSIGEKVNDVRYFNGNGNINKDKYGNVKFFINTDDYCLYKTSFGKIKISEHKCINYGKISVEQTSNNSVVSFKSDKNLYYKVSNQDDLKGDWVYGGSDIVIKSFDEGDNYIWFKDTEGRLSDVIKFNMSCIYTEEGKYDENIYYCIGSSIIIDGIDWLVVDMSNDEMTLMSRYAIGSMPLVVNDNGKDYKWSDSNVNNKLNNEFINELPSNIKDRIIEKSICNDFSIQGCKNNEGCGGYLKEVIDNNKWHCSNYTASKVRLLSFDEYNRIYTSPHKNNFMSEYWIINTFEKNKGSVIQSNGEVYIMEDLTSSINVKPVITISR